MGKICRAQRFATTPLLNFNKLSLSELGYIYPLFFLGPVICYLQSLINVHDVSEGDEGWKGGVWRGKCVPSDPAHYQEHLQ